MDLHIVPLPQWQAAAERVLPCPQAVFRIDMGSGGSLRIVPGLTVHLDLRVLGQDWVPVRPDGLSTLEQMVHTPLSFLDKARNIVREGDRVLARPGRETRLHGRALLMGGSTGYYHWMIDSLPRLLLARQHGIEAGCRVLVNDDLAGFQRETLDLLGVTEDRLVPVAPDECIHADSICVPTLLASTSAVHPMARTLLQEALPARVSAGRRRIYLSRQDAAWRRLVNEPEVIALLTRHGFECLKPSEMSVQDQIDACASAEAVVAVHGAALTNTLFCRAGTQVFELYTPQYRSTFYVLLAQIGRLTHRMVPCRVVDPRPELSPLYHDWESDLDALEQALRTLPPR